MGGAGDSIAELDLSGSVSGVTCASRVGGATQRSFIGLETVYRQANKEFWKSLNAHMSPMLPSTGEQLEGQGAGWVSFR